MFNLDKKHLKTLLESSMSDFENNQLDKIIRKVNKHKSNIESMDNHSMLYNSVFQLSLTEGILFPTEIKKELILPLRVEVNNFLYESFTYHSLFKKIGCEPYNLKYSYLSRLKELSEKIFIDTTLSIDTLSTNYYKNIKKHLDELNIKSSLKSQGITIEFKNLDEIISFTYEMEFILSSSYNSMITESLKNEYILKTTLTHYKDDENYLYNETKFFTNLPKNKVIKEGIFKVLNTDDIIINKFNSIYYIDNLMLPLDLEISKFRKKFSYNGKNNESAIFIPKNENARHIYDYGYFNEKSFKKLIKISHKNPVNCNNSRREDLDYLINNFKFI